MGHVLHHAIVVTSWDGEMAAKAHEKAITLGCAVTPIIESAVNADSSFLIGPDGSKSGWENSDNGDAQRAAWITWARRQAYDDGSSALCWAEVAYGSDDQTARVERHQWDDTAKGTANMHTNELSNSRGGT